MFPSPKPSRCTSARRPRTRRISPCRSRITSRMWPRPRSIPTWPEQAIRANVYAQMSYALNRVFTEWYRAQGYDFDITNSTRYDQSFVPGRDIFENISTIVDDMIGNLPHPRRRDRAAVHAILQRHDRHLSGRAEPVGNGPAGRAGTFRRGDLAARFTADDINFVTGAPLSPNLGGSFPGVDTAARRLFRGCAHRPDPPQPHFDQFPEHPEDLSRGRRVQRGHRTRRAGRSSGSSTSPRTALSAGQHGTASRSFIIMSSA